MRLPRLWPVLVGAVLVVLPGAGSTGAGGPQRIEIRIHHSSFNPDAIAVPHGVAITFVLVNEDPIYHEWLIGDAAFHQRHRHGTEAHHGARPNEVSIDALTTVETTLIFDKPGSLQYICHLPGHETYGMVGTLTIT